MHRISHDFTAAQNPNVGKHQNNNGQTSVRCTRGRDRYVTDGGGRVAAAGAPRALRKRNGARGCDTSSPLSFKGTVLLSRRRSKTESYDSPGASRTYMRLRIAYVTTYNRRRRRAMCGRRSRVALGGHLRHRILGGCVLTLVAGGLSSCRLGGIAAHSKVDAEAVYGHGGGGGARPSGPCQGRCS